MSRRRRESSTVAPRRQLRLHPRPDRRHPRHLDTGHGRVGVARVVRGNDRPQALAGDSRAIGLAGRAATLPAGKSRRVQCVLPALGIRGHRVCTSFSIWLSVSNHCLDAQREAERRGLSASAGACYWATGHQVRPMSKYGRPPWPPPGNGHSFQPFHDPFGFGCCRVCTRIDRNSRSISSRL